MTEDVRLIEIFEGTLWEASLLKSILEDNGVMTALYNETRGVYSFQQSIATRVLVRSNDLEVAEKVLKEFSLNQGYTDQE